MAVVLHDLRLISFILLCISSGLLADPRINLDSGDISPDFVRPHTNVELACNVHDLPGNRLDQVGGFAHVHSFLVVNTRNTCITCIGAYT